MVGAVGATAAGALPGLMAGVWAAPWLLPGGGLAATRVALGPRAAGGQALVLWLIYAFQR